MIRPGSHVFSCNGRNGFKMSEVFLPEHEWPCRNGRFLLKSFNHVDALALVHWMVGLRNCKVTPPLYPGFQLPGEKNFRLINHSQDNLISTHPTTVIDPLPNTKILFIQYQTGFLLPNPVDTQILLSSLVYGFRFRYVWISWCRVFNNP